MIEYLGIEVLILLIIKYFSRLTLVETLSYNLNEQMFNIYFWGNSTCG